MHRVSLACAILVGMATFALGVALAQSESTSGSDAPASRNALVDGFQARYQAIPTPTSDDSQEALQGWLEEFRGTMECAKGLAYRGNELPPGRYDLWIEKGKDEWQYLVVGSREDDKAPRLRALFRMYEEEDSVSQLGFALKLVSKATKLKFSVRVGPYEGHGNLRILSATDDE